MEFQLLSDGFELHRGVVNRSITSQTRADIWNVITEITGKNVPCPPDGLKFASEATEMLWDAFNERPAARNEFYTYCQRIPAIYHFPNHEVVANVLKRSGFQKPSVREIKLHFYFPWEKTFFQPVHQDINSLDSARSVTFTIPFHENDAKHSVSFWQASHKEGPVVHDREADPEFATFHAKVPEKYLGKYEVHNPPLGEGDMGVHDRLCFHKSPRFEDARYLRISLVMIFDDLSQGGIFANRATKYQSYTPNDLKYHDEVILPTIRKYLSQKPKISWPEKKQRLGMSA